MAGLDLFTKAYLEDFDALVQLLCEETGFAVDVIFGLRGAHNYWHRRQRKHKIWKDAIQPVGGVDRQARPIAEPKPRLRHVQDVLYKHVVRQLPVHEAAHGHVLGRNTRSAVKPHAAADILVTADTKDFYTHINRGRIEARLRQLGAGKNNVQLITDLCTCTGALPQGAPTSPALANTTSYDLDEVISKAAQRYNFAYTRFVDDLLFSRRQLGKRVISTLLVEAVCKQLAPYGLSIHEPKVMRAHQRQEALSLILNAAFTGGWARVPREERRKLRAALHQKQKNVRAREWDDTTLQGKLAYQQQVDKETSPLMD